MGCGWFEFGCFVVYFVGLIVGLPVASGWVLLCGRTVGFIGCLGIRVDCGGLSFWFVGVE